MKPLVIALCMAFAWSIIAGTAWADPAFQKQFFAKYVDGNKNEKWVTLVKKKVKCNVCHDPTRRDVNGRKSKKFRNAYGKELAKILDRKKDRKAIKKIQTALDTVAGLKSDPKNPKSPTYGELIRRGKLPAG